jgi:hypothetical protein
VATERGQFENPGKGTSAVGTGTRGLVKDSKPKGLSVCSELSAVGNTCRLCNSEIAIGL